MTAMLIALIALALGAPMDEAPGSLEVECTFANPRYVGTCVERATPEEGQTPAQACEVILSCLNDSRCVTSFCQATTIRSGWTLVSAKADQEGR